MLSFGQHTEGGHNVTFCVLQQLDPQICRGRGSKRRSWLPHMPWVKGLTPHGPLSSPVFLSSTHGGP